MSDVKETIAAALHPHVDDSEFVREVAATTVLSALTERGFVVVPVEPTEEMLNALYGRSLPKLVRESACSDYRAMIRAAKKEDGE